MHVGSRNVSGVESLKACPELVEGLERESGRGVLPRLLFDLQPWIPGMDVLQG